MLRLLSSSRLWLSAASMASTDASAATAAATAVGSNSASSSAAIGELIKRCPVVVFMKGIPEAPKCGFSNAVVQILRMHGVKYEAHDVLENDTLRQGIKEHTQWPTIPQVFVAGEFVGGCDILLQMHQSGELIEEFKKVGIRSALLDKVTSSAPAAAAAVVSDNDKNSTASPTTSTTTTTVGPADTK